MTRARIPHRAAGILAPAPALAPALAISTTPTPASARTFKFNSAGPMVPQPLPPGCVIRRALSRGSRRVHCRKPRCSPTICRDPHRA
jgi:hypothetical protein